MSLQHILLGLLHHESGSGYDLNKRLQVEGQHFWTTDQSQIYRALYKMQELAWVDFETVIQEDSPNKKVYHITDDGVAELKRWLSEPIDEAAPNAVWLAQLYLGAGTNQEVIHKLLAQRLNKVREFKEWIQANHDAIHQQKELTPMDKLRSLTLEYKLQVIDTELIWLETTLEELQTVFAP